jgi:hypothetical protein
MQTLKTGIPHNFIGALASGLCLVHCLLTPIVFAVQGSLLAHGHEHPYWWGLLDSFFLVVSFLAVWRSSKTTTKNWVRYALWISWLFLSAIILNEKMTFVPAPEFAIYFPTIALIGLHLYNRKYCFCTNNSCCIHTDRKSN